MSDTAPKSAYEIAMERLRKRDAESGVVERPLTEEQKATIAEARNVYEAKVAERQILHQSSLSRTFDPAEREKLEENYRRDLERLASDRDAKIASARNAAG